MASSIKRLWKGLPLSYVYHLVNYGLSNTEIVKILLPLITNRTPDAIQGITTDVRKYVTGQSGDLGPAKLEAIRAASKMSAHPTILKYKPERTDVSVRPVAARPPYITKKVKQESTNEDPFAQASIPYIQVAAPNITNPGAITAPEWIKARNEQVIKSPSHPTPEPTQTMLVPTELDELRQLIAFVKPLGATEVEWKGAKIKF